MPYGSHRPSALKLTPVRRMMDRIITITLIMLKLTHFRLCPHSRSIRLALGELELAAEHAEERPFDYRPAFLALNPAGELPVLQVEGALMLSGSCTISEYLARPLLATPSPATFLRCSPATSRRAPRSAGLSTGGTASFIAR